MFLCVGQEECRKFDISDAAGKEKKKKKKKKIKVGGDKARTPKKEENRCRWKLVLQYQGMLLAGMAILLSKLHFLERFSPGVKPTCTLAPAGIFTGLFRNPRRCMPNFEFHLFPFINTGFDRHIILRLVRRDRSRSKKAGSCPKIKTRPRILHPWLTH